MAKSKHVSELAMRGTSGRGMAPKCSARSSLSHLVGAEGVVAGTAHGKKKAQAVKSLQGKQQQIDTVFICPCNQSLTWVNDSAFRFGRVQ